LLTNGVDLAREERLKKCDLIISAFESILKADSLIKIIAKENNDEVFIFLCR